MRPAKEKGVSSKSSRTKRVPALEEATLSSQLTSLKHLLNEIAVRYGRSTSRGCVDRPEVFIHTPREVAELLMEEMQDLEQEELRVVLLSSKNRLLDVTTLYRGTLNSSPVRVGEVFKAAITANAASIIAVHCHPSRDPTPSPEDVKVTGELVKAGALLDIECLDHIIIGRGRFVSLKERQLGF